MMLPMFACAANGRVYLVDTSGGATAVNPAQATGSAGIDASGWVTRRQGGGGGTFNSTYYKWAQDVTPSGYEATMFMPVTNVVSGGPFVGTTSAAGSTGTGQIGDLIIAVVSHVHGTQAASISGFTAVSGGDATAGNGADGLDSGNVRIQVFQKVATSTSETVTATKTTETGTAMILRTYRIQMDTNTNGTGLASTYDVVATTGSDTDGTTSYSVTGSLDIQPYDFILAATALNSDVATMTGGGFTATGVTFTGGAERGDSGTTNGDDCALIVNTATCAVDTPVANTSITFSGTLSATSPEGPTALVRVRCYRGWIAMTSTNYVTVTISDTSGAIQTVDAFAAIRSTGDGFNYKAYAHFSASAESIF